jgi:hypothetical protein
MMKWFITKCRVTSYFGLKWHVAYCWGVWKSDGVHEHKSHNGSTQVKEETKNLRKPVLTSKVVNPFTRALVPHFTGSRRDFFIPRIPSNLKNIPGANTYMNVFYIPWFAGLISYIYKPATSSHSKLGHLKWRLWLGFSQVPENHHSKRFSNWGSPRFPNFAGFRFPEFHQILVTLKRTADSRTEAYFDY